MLSKVELSLLRLMRMLPTPFFMLSLKVIVGVAVTGALAASSNGAKADATGAELSDVRMALTCRLSMRLLPVVVVAPFKVYRKRTSDCPSTALIAVKSTVAKAKAVETVPVFTPVSVVKPPPPTL